MTDPASRTEPVSRRPGPLALGISAAVAIGLVALLVALALGQGTECPEPPVVIEAQIDFTSLEPSELRACRGQEVTLRLTPEFDGIVHIHGIEIAREIRDGQPLDLVFTPQQSGQFVIETHTHDSDEAPQVGVLIVDEP